MTLYLTSSTHSLYCPRSVMQKMVTMASKKPINLFRGWPNASLLPTRALKEASATALSNPSISNPGLWYGPDPGYQPLRESIAKWLNGFYHSSISPKPSRVENGKEGNEEIGWSGVGAESICITGGASQNLACVLQVYSDPGITTVWMVAPCYYLACNIFADAGLEMKAVGMGRDGIDLEALEKGMKGVDKDGKKTKPIKAPKPWSKTYRHVIYSVPTFSNPSGLTMSLSTRTALVRLARKYDALLVTDDVYDFLQFPLAPSSSSVLDLPSPAALQLAPQPRLYDIDLTLEPRPGSKDFGNTISNGSFSKLAGPGLRTGWAAATPPFIHGLSQAGSTRSGGSASQLTATYLDILITNSSLQSYIETVLKPSYQRRHALLMSAVHVHLTPLGVRVLGVDDEMHLPADSDSFEGGKGEEKIFGGYFVLLRLPNGVAAKKLATSCAEEEQLTIAPGHLFEVEGDGSLKFEQEVRLCFAWEAEQELVEGVERMGRVLKGMVSV
ncbi:pyridoxal phosphate-dependent transferase [Calycina marina]|uniref:Pyridoxal phosphate-dependent transferase n=1 Tax=Calycina marina TaxID=1763456 RepID=A0A9P8CCS0_9HELO|nr:pyridoxal phosphate-dependent transferase [Calycina marina]